MAAKKRTTTRASADQDVVKPAAKAGKDAAHAVMNRRRAVHRARKRRAAQPVSGPRRALVAKPRPARIPEATRALLGSAPTAGVLIAEGDSWFDYPGNDVLGLLEDDYGFDVESVAHKGDRVEDMAHSQEQFMAFTRRLEKLLQNNKVPRAVLLSGGGNDIAGDEFGMLLNHAASGLPRLNEDIVRGVIDVRLQAAYASIISGITTVAKSYLGKPIPIVTHGYDYAIPDGRGFLGGFWFLPGPWLKPGFTAKGYGDLTANTAVVAQLINRFNTMLQQLTTRPEYAHVHYLNLRKTLRGDGKYKSDWANELHPSQSGFKLVARKFATLLQTLS
jgi:hypothetical protein